MGDLGFWVGPGAALVMLGLALLALLARAWVGAVDDGAEARVVAAQLAACLRTLDAWPVVEGAATGLATVPLPPAVAVIGREAQLDRWSLQAAQALRRYDLLLEPEGDR